MMKCWLEDWLDFLFPEPVEQDGEPSFEELVQREFERTGKAALKELERLQQFPKPPEMYLRPELIPIEERDDTPKIADRYVRSRH